MAACESLHHIFEKPLPESPTTLLDSISSWKHIQKTKSIDQESSFTNIFGELHFKENPNSAPSSPTGHNRSASVPNYFPASRTRHYRHSDSFSSMNSESLSLCTEGLGFESSDDVEDSIDGDDWRISVQKHTETENEFKRSRKSGGESKSQSQSQSQFQFQFPPPISCIGRSGKPWVCFKSYRRDGRFILKEERNPMQEFLHASREDGRLKLRFIQSDDEFDEEEEEDFEENEERENDERDEKEEVEEEIMRKGDEDRGERVL